MILSYMNVRKRTARSSIELPNAYANGLILHPRFLCRIRYSSITWEAEE